MRANPRGGLAGNDLGIVAGGGTDYGSFVPATELAFFTFTPPNAPICSTAASGYSGC